jgi:MFS family permease
MRSMPPPAARRFLGWDTVVGAAGVQMLQAALVFQSFGIYVVAWSDELGWSRAAIATGYGIASVVSGVVGPLHGRLLERVGVRPVVIGGMVAVAAGLAWLSTVTTLEGFFGAMLLSGVGLAGIGFLSVTSSVVPWFARRRALALAVVSLGVSVGGLTVPIVALVVVEIGWRTTMLASAGAFLALGIPFALLMRGSPAAYGQLPDGASTEAPVSASRRSPPIQAPRPDFTLQQALRTAAFWQLNVSHGLAIVVVSAVSVHLIPHLNGDLGFSLQMAAQITALVTATTAIGQLAGGFLGDRFEKRRIATLAMFVQLIALVLLTVGHSPASVIAFAVAQGLSWGLRGPMMGALRADYFGTRHFGSIMGASMLLFMAGDVIGPVAAGLVADQVGEYRTVFAFLGVLAALSAAGFWLARPPEPAAVVVGSTEIPATVAPAAAVSPPAS